MLIWVVGGVTLELHPVVSGAMQPFADIVIGHPVTPTDLKPLVEVELINGKRDEARRQDREDADFSDKNFPVFLLERMGSVSARFGATGRVILLGVVAEAHTIRGSFHARGERKPKNAATLMNLGIVFKASTIIECVDTALASEGWERI